MPDENAQHILYQQLGRIEGKVDALMSTTSRAHQRIDDIEKDLDAAKQNLSKDLNDFRTATLTQFTKFAEVQARHTVIVGIVSSIIAVVVAKFINLQ